MATRHRPRLRMSGVGRDASGDASDYYLAAQAAALAAGNWVQLTGMTGLDYALVTDPSGNGNILDYSNKGGRDVLGGRLLFQGGAHTGTGGLTGAIRYVDATNTWDKITPSYSSTLSHNWDSSCTDPVRGDFYAYTKTSGNFRRLPSGSTTWENIASASISNPESVSLFWDETRDGLMCWNRNTGLEFWGYSAGVGSWTNLGDPGIAGSLGMAGCYCHANGDLFLSDGSTNTTKFWIYTAAGAFSSPLTAPVPVYVNEGGSNLVNSDSGSQRVLVANKTTGVMKSFNPISRLWRTFTPSNGVLPLAINTANTDGFTIALPDLGCMLFFSGNNNFEDPSCYLYKHTSAPIVPASITVSTTHDMTQYVEDYDSGAMLLSIQGTLPGTMTFDGANLVGSGTATGISLVVTPL